VQRCHLAGHATDERARRHAAALSSKIKGLEAAADYSESKAAHEREVAGINEAIRADQAALTQITEDTR
jgi:hypothetical protein